MKILVAVDGSEYTKHMLAYWAAHDEWLGPEHSYTVLTVVQAVPPRAAAVLDRETLQGYYADEGEQVFKPIRAFLDQRQVRATFLSKTGSVGDVINKTAADFDLVMMGSHGHGALANLAMGSVVTRVLAGCKTPLLLIR